MDAAYRLRPAEERDLATLPGIERHATRLYAEQLDGAVLELTRQREELGGALTSGWLWVAVEAQDRPVGFAMGRELASGAHLDELDVDPAHGRRGIGRALVERLCRSARLRGFPEVTLTTYADVPWNAPFFERLGFRVLGRGEIPEALCAVIDEEAGRGLDWNRRVVMRRRVSWRPALMAWATAVWLGAMLALSTIATLDPLLLYRTQRLLQPLLPMPNDKQAHFLLMGGLASCAVLGLVGRRIGTERISAPRVLAWVAAGATIEELLQYWQPTRSCSAVDLAASLAGIATFGGGAWAWLAWRRRAGAQ